MIHILVATALGGLAAVTLVVAFVMFGVLGRLSRQGPSAAEEACQRGETIPIWWDACRPQGGVKPGLAERHALSGRRSNGLGIVAVEERASHSSYAG